MNIAPEQPSGPLNPAKAKGEPVIIKHDEVDFFVDQTIQPVNANANNNVGAKPPVQPEAEMPKQPPKQELPQELMPPQEEKKEIQLTNIIKPHSF